MLIFNNNLITLLTTLLIFTKLFHYRLSRRRMYLSSGVPMTNVIKKNTYRPEYMLERRSENWSTRRTFYYGLLKY